MSVAHLSDEVKEQLHHIVQKKKGGRGRCESRSEQPMMIVEMAVGAEGADKHVVGTCQPNRIC